ncbi:mucin-2 protein [Nocardioides sp. MAHUQ-72]|uniref:mucin-2 protein n=1 Tax=unclassified Nocardioides TaxID=2615069 RepID=UPI00361CF466
MAIRHKRDTDARRKPRAALIAGPLALLATASAVTIGVLSQDPATTDVIAASDATTSADITTDRAAIVSRSESRLASVRGERYILHLQDAYDRRLTERAIEKAHVHLWTTAPLNLWTSPDKDAEKVGLVKEGKKVLVTGRRTADRTELVVGGKARWVTAGYLAEDKPVADPATDTTTDTTARTSTAGLSTAPCPDGSVESGLTSDAVMVYRAVCNAFPQITTYGGWDAHGEHASGRAIDIMTSDKALGDQIAAFLQAHASELNLYDVIWWDQIWTPERASEGWRDYGDHGSATANHMDHVHVSTNG